MVADQRDLGLAVDHAGLYHRHAVVLHRRRLAIDHRIARPAETLVGEAARQLQQRQARGLIANRRDRAVRALDRLEPCGRLNLACEQAEQRPGEGRGAGYCGAGAKQAPPVEATWCEGWVMRAASYPGRFELEWFEARRRMGPFRDWLLHRI